VLIGLTRGEAMLTGVVFLLVYSGVMLPRFGQLLGVFFTSRRETAPSPGDGDRRT
jgi:hypothetical protein